MQQDLHTDPITLGWVMDMLTPSCRLLESSAGAVGDRARPHRVLTRIEFRWSRSQYGRYRGQEQPTTDTYKSTQGAKDASAPPVDHLLQPCDCGAYSGRADSALPRFLPSSLHDSPNFSQAGRPHSGWQFNLILQPVFAFRAGGETLLDPFRFTG